MPPVNLDAVAKDLDQNPTPTDDDWEPSDQDRGDQGLNADFVPRETSDPDPKDDVDEDDLADELDVKDDEPDDEPEEEEEEDEADEEPEGESDEPEAEDEPEGEEDEPKAKKPHAVPQARLNKEIDRRKAIEAENEQLRSQVEEQAAATDEAAEEIQTQMRELVSKEHEAILNGETEKAGDFRQQHSELQTKLMQQQMAAVQQNATRATKAEMAFDDAVSALTEQYPIFDPSSDSFDQDLLNDVLRDRDAFYNAGTPLADALTRAVKISVAINGLESQGEPDAAPQAPKKDTKATAKKLKAAKQQPPALRGKSSPEAGPGKMDVAALSEEDFDALPEATIRRLRGDD